MKNMVKRIGSMLSLAKTAVLASVILGASVVAAAVILKNPPGYDFPDYERVTRVMSVTVEKVVPQSYQSIIKSYGRVQVQEKVPLKSQLSGRIKQTSDKLFSGGLIRESEILLEIDPTEQRQKLAVAKLKLEQAEISAEKHKNTVLQKAEELALLKQNPKFSELLAGFDFQAGGQQLDSQRESIEVSLSLEKAKMDFEQARRDLENTVIRAPFDARILKAAPMASGHISSGGLVAEIYPINAFEVRLPFKLFDLPYLQLPDVKLAQAKVPDVEAEGATLKDAEVAYAKVKIINPLVEGDAQEWAATVHHIEPGMDEKNNALHVVAHIGNPFATKQAGKAPLVVGQYVAAEVKGKMLEQRIMVPRQLIRDAQYVYTLREGKITKNPVEIGWRDAKFAEITAGLEVGELLITTELDGVYGGTPATVEQKQKAPEVSQ